MRRRGVSDAILRAVILKMGVMLDSDLRKTHVVLFLLGMVLLLAIVPVRYASAEGKEILLINGEGKEILLINGYEREDKTYAVPQRDLAIMMKKLRSYVYEEYGKGDCDDLPELDDDHTFLAGSFTMPHAKQYITAYTSCFAGGPFNDRGESWVAVFEKNNLVVVFKTIGNLHISTPIDINEDGKDEFLIFSGYMHMGEARDDFSITEIYNNKDITLYADVDYDVCTSLEHNEESFSKFYLVKGKTPKIRIENFSRKVSVPACTSEKSFKLIKEYSVLIDIEKQRNVTDETKSYNKNADDKIKYHNNFKPFYSVQVAALKTKESTTKLKAIFAKSHYPSFDYDDEEDLNHFLLGRFIDRKSALAAWHKLKEAFPEQSAFQQEPVIRYFDGRRWSLSTSNGKGSVKLYFYDKRTNAPLGEDYFKIRSHPENKTIRTDRYGYAFSPDGLKFDCSIPIEPLYVHDVKNFSPKNMMMRCGNKERSLSDDSVFVKYRLVDKKSRQAIKGSIHYFLFDKKDKENKVIFEGYTDDEGYALLVNVFVDFTFSLGYYSKHGGAKYANPQLVEVVE